MINPLQYNRRRSRRVYIGHIPLGSNEKIRLQSMTNTDTSDIQKTADQVIEIYEAGAEYVRITVQSSNVAEKIPLIKSIIDKKGYTIPLIADIHFSPKAAEISAKYIEKVRINPGNYIDKKQFKHIEYTDDEYLKEINRIRENIIPLIKLCKENKTAIRIGTNHGSLSDRIMSRYGDTPLGMVESTMEFLRVFNEEQFNDIVISMKASNPIVMIHAVRLLVKTMEDEGMDYPLHLGVTEAGNETEGRVKSAIGIGALLADGIGDTIRVSLTESPAKEIPVAKLIVNTFKADLLFEFKAPNISVPSSYDPYSYKRRKTSEIDIIGSENVPVVISDLSKELNNHALLKCGFEYKEDDKRFHPGENSSDFIYIGENNKNETISEDIRIIQSENIINATEFTINQDLSKIRFIQFNSGDVIDFDFKLLKDLKDMVIIADITQSKSPVHEARILFFSLMNFNLDFPVLIKVDVDMITEKEVIEISANVGSLFIDGFGDGVWISSKDNIREARELSFSILQACRTRITKTDYISCPSCGRTLFNLEETTAKIKERTAHLKGVKIGIMGCIVNGPGEMADADFGYVGTGKGKVTLYKKQEVVKRNIPEEDALDELLKLIEQYY